jgi:hypothetical protein
VSSLKMLQINLHASVIRSFVEKTINNVHSGESIMIRVIAIPEVYNTESSLPWEK